MLQEERAQRIVYDAPGDTAHVTTGLPSGATKGGSADVDLLLDKDGFLVGIDLGGGGLSRVVVMLGPHEAVARTKPSQAEIIRDPSGRVAEIVIAKAGSAIKGSLKNPYL